MKPSQKAKHIYGSKITTFLTGLATGAFITLAVVLVISTYMYFARLVGFTAPGAMYNNFISNLDQKKQDPPTPTKTPQQLYAEALEKSANIKALYMTAYTANSDNAYAKKLRNDIITTATSTEINGIVIDVKEVCGPEYDEQKIKELLSLLHKNNLWAIARIVAFKDASRIKSNPEWYLRRKRGVNTSREECAKKTYLQLPPKNKTQQNKEKIVLWKDKRGGYWLDPSHPEVQRYIVQFSKKIIDLGFDELQFDYIRFPSDGDLQNASYPHWDKKKQKYEVLKEFFELLSKSLREYKPDIILSADLFGYTALLARDLGIGQRLEDIGNNFDYISFMLYPSHYYSGIKLPIDKTRGLPAINFSREEARKHPDIVVERSLIIARDFLDRKINNLYSTTTSTLNTAEKTASSSTASSSAASSSLTKIINTEEKLKPRSSARLRPWLEDFYHQQDKAASRPYGVKKVRLQIEAVERTENSGWMLWNSSNIYTKEALKKTNKEGIVEK